MMKQDKSMAELKKERDALKKELKEKAERKKLETEIRELEAKKSGVIQFGKGLSKEVKKWFKDQKHKRSEHPYDFEGF